MFPKSANLTFECGSQDFSIWDRHNSDFGQCFFHMLQLTIFGVFSIISSYYIGKRRINYSSSHQWNSCQIFLIYARSFAVSLLAVIALIQLMVHVGLHPQQVSFTEIAVSTVKTVSWILHLVYVLRLRGGNSFNTRGPKLMVLFWFITAVVSGLEFRSTYNISQRNFNQSLHGFHELVDMFRKFFIPSEASLWFWGSAAEFLMQGIIALTLIPTTSHLEPMHYMHRQRVNDVLYSAYEGAENNSYTGFDEDFEEIPLGTAKEGANYFELLFFTWVTPMMKKGACGFLRTAEALFELPLSLSTNNVAIEFQRWTVTRGFTLLRSLHVSFGCEFYSVGILKFISGVMGFCGPILLNQLVTFIETGDNTEEIWQGYAYVGGLFFSAIIGALSNTHFNMKMAEVNLKIRAALITSMYRKTLHMRKTTLDKFSAGEIINFMSTDTDRIVNFCPSFHAFWGLPLEVAVTLYLLYTQIGVAFLAGLIFAIVLIPINRMIANKIGELSTKMMQFKDQRVKLMSEILYGIRTLKFHSWETYFFDRVNDIRQKEIKNLKGRKYLDAMCVYFWATTPVLISVLSFGTYVLLGNSLTAAKVFTSIALFNMLISPLNALPWVLNGVVEAWVSIKRINKFLQEEETAPSSVYTQLPSMMRDTTAILANDCFFDWGQGHENSSQSLDVRNLNMRVSKGQFIGIIGNVASGKTTLLYSLLGELNRTSGEVSVPDPVEGIGLVLQEAWIQRGTIRSNICFAPNTNITRYKSVIDSCCLKEDLDSFKFRDDTIVGENGLSLSGGQKIRLTLARAVYQDFNLYIFDDIFAAVDYKVAKSLYRKCIMGILKNKTRIVCTHHTQFLKDADWILVVNGGRVIDEGTPAEILPRHRAKEITNQNTEDLNESAGTSLSVSTSLPNESQLSKASEYLSDSQMVKSGHSYELGHDEENDSCSLNEENQQEGTIQFHVFYSYYAAVGPILFWSIILSLFAMQATRNFSDIWLAYWVSQTQNNGTDPIPYINVTTTTTTPSVESNSNTGMFTVIEDLPFLAGLDPEVRRYFFIFILIGLTNSVFTLARAFLFALGGILGALKIHASLLTSILKAKMSFFDSTPIGRILNRFSSDVATIDDSLPFISNILLAQAFGLLGTLTLTCYALPWILVVIIPLLLVCSNIQEYYRHTARQLRRLGSVSLSPVYAHFSETLKGLVVIRAMRTIRKFEETNENYLESSQKCQYSIQAVSQWLSFRLQMVGVVIVTSVGLLGIFQHHYGTADPGIIGLAISYALTVTNALNGFVTVLTETEKEMVAVERACEYIEEVEEEKQVEISGTSSRRGRSNHTSSLDSNAAMFLWPCQGVIHFRTVSLRYRDNLPYVLKDISFETRPAEKIGICGRTGSGKSSLFNLLFRMVDHFEGEITIDHVNIKAIALKELRSKMCIIPQDPFIFSGTLRENLDPVGDRNDEDITRALEKCQLRSLVYQLGGLDAFVGDGGNLLSTGQKQLVCLARAVLVNAKILCIDEATANVDLETDQVIQATLRNCFNQSTVITIAHRINSLHCDRVLVMSKGELIEFEDPSLLMEQRSSHFYQLAHGNV